MTTGLKEAFHAGCLHRRGRAPEAVSGKLAEGIHMQWTSLTSEGARLSNARGPIKTMTTASASLVASLLAALTIGTSSAMQFICLLPPAVQKSGLNPNPNPVMLKVGAGNPGRLGCCSDFAGNIIKWDKLYGKPWSAITAMQQLNLDVLGLPGARLPGDVKLPGNHDYQIVARGGPSYASTAVIWKSTAEISTQINTV
jgi:hypothetical protein